MVKQGLLMALAALAMPGVLTLGGCSNDFAPPSEVDTLRALGVRAEPASGAPGQTSTLELVVADGAVGPRGALEPARPPGPRPLQVAWLGACHNPPTRHFFGCFPVLSAIAAQLSPRVLDTPVADLPAGVLGFGTRFALPVPLDILRSAPKSPNDPVHFGVSYAFFAACAGELRARPDLTQAVPLDCVDPQTGQALGRRDFVTGYATLYSYEGVINQNPVLASVRFDNVPVSAAACTEDADCAGLVDPAQAGFAQICGSQGQCALSVPCSATACPALLVSPDVLPADAEALPAENAREILWANFYSTSGSFDTATQLVNDRSSGFISDHGSYFHPAPSAPNPATLWVTVHDQRGGSAFQSFEVWSH